MDEQKTLKQLRRLINLVLIIFWLVSLGLNLIVALAIPGIDWRIYVLAASGAFSTAAFVGHYAFKERYDGNGKADQRA